MIPIIPLALRFWKPLAGAAVLGIALWQLHAYGERRYQAGQASTQAEWDSANLITQRTADKATADREKQDAADAARNEVLADAHRKELAAATADRDRYARQLRNAIAATASSSGASPRPDISNPAGTSEAGRAEEAGGATQPDLAAAIADLMVEARQNADAKDALVAQLKPQMQ